MSKGFKYGRSSKFVEHPCRECGNALGMDSNNGCHPKCWNIAYQRRLIKGDGSYITLSPDQRADVVKKVRRLFWSVNRTAKHYNVSPGTIYNILKEQP